MGGFEHLNRRRALGLGLGSLVGATVLAACSGQSTSTSASGDTATTGQALTLHVFTGGMNMVKGPDGNYHDAIVPSSFVVKAGVPVQLTVVNYDEMQHSITAPDLNLNLMIKPGKKGEGDTAQPVSTTGTFTAPNKGTYRWFCAFPCDDDAGGWAMKAGYGGQDQDGFMAGNIIVI